MSLFYIPESYTVFEIPLLIYPMKGIESVIDREERNSIYFHFEKLFEQHKFLKQAAFHITILWEENNTLMTDVWLYKTLESEEAGYTIDCVTFRGFEKYSGEGITAADGLIMLGRETELEEEMRKNGKLVKDYIFGERPLLPNDLHPTETFYT